MAPIRCRLLTAVLGVSVALLLAAPAVAQDVQWRHDPQAARREAREKNRPVVMDFGTANCFWCKKLDATTFRDPAVVRLLNERFIPVKIDADKEAALTQSLRIQAFPTLVFLGPDGKTLGMHEGFVDVARFNQQLQRALSESKRTETPATAAAALPAATGQPVVRSTLVPIGELAAAPDRPRVAREQLALARDDYRQERYACCLERCAALTADYADLPEGAAARELAERLKADPVLARRAREALAERLGELYLELAEDRLRQQQPEKAADELARVVTLCPGSRAAAAAEQRLARLRPALAAQPSGQPKIRAQSP